MQSIGKLILALVMGLIGLLGLLITLCGGVFTIQPILNASGGSVGILVMSVPAMAVGASLIWAAYKYFSRKKIDDTPKLVKIDYDSGSKRDQG
jgi:hypothetical protein